MLDVVRNWLRSLAMANEQPQLPAGVEHIAARRVVHGVVGRRCAWHLGVEHLEVLGDLLQRGVVGRAHAQEARIEGRHVLRQQRLRVAFGVDRDKEHLHLVGIRPQLLHDRLQLSHGGRAHIGTMRIAEEHHHRLALEVRDRAHLAVVIGEDEVLAEFTATGDIDVLERRTLLAACSKQQRAQRQQAQPAEGGESGQEARREAVRHAGSGGLASHDRPAIGRTRQGHINRCDAVSPIGAAARSGRDKMSQAAVRPLSLAAGT
ncbi:hypothetical protein CF70_029185 [Cupriavidus sp. SK-3]|nr:hypothetical protein CF70_029185 [Cupriavidus sp. SK-3]